MKRIALLGFLVACSGNTGTDIQSTLSFRERTDADITRLVDAARGREGIEAAQTVVNFDTTGDSVLEFCPEIQISGSIVTVTGGCTTKTKIRVEGTATVTNGWSENFEEGKDSIYELHGLAVTDHDTRRTYDGAYTVGLHRDDMDITVDVQDLAIRSDIHIDDCGDHGCALDGGVEIIDVGGARVTGRMRLGGDDIETYTLEGSDSVNVTMANDCVSWSIAGSSDRHFAYCE